MSKWETRRAESFQKTQRVQLLKILLSTYAITPARILESMFANDKSGTPDHALDARFHPLAAIATSCGVEAR
jgi:hypothetical protein